MFASSCCYKFVSVNNKNFNPKLKDSIMKTKLLVAAALLFSASAFAQTAENTKSEHGTKVSTAAKSKTEVTADGKKVSGSASMKTEASVKRNNQTVEERQQARADRQAARETRKQERKEFVAEVKSDNEARVKGTSGEVRSEVEARKELLIEKRAEAKEAREEAKADRKSSEGALLKTETKAAAKAKRADRKTKKAERGVKVKTGVKADTGVKLRRPKVGAKVQGSAGLGLGI